MKIKLHNSLGKIDHGKGFRILFDEKTLICLSSNRLFFTYRIDDEHFFLAFSQDIKDFEEWSGFGVNEKDINPNWFKDPFFDWKEMSEKDEDKTA